MTLMPKKNSKRRVYSRPIKPVKEMTEAEIDAFASAMYERMMGLMPGPKESDKSDSD
jgi:hypothetical protein